MSDQKALVNKIGRRSAHRAKAPEVKNGPINETYGLLSALNALLGAITPNLRAFTIHVSVQERIVKAAFFYDGKISDEDFDIANCVLTEIISDFPPDYTLEESIERLDYPAAIPIVGRLVFQRKED